jgi:DNA-binding response OmpR family regulator
VADPQNKIFIVEDDVEVADMLRAFFGAQGYDIGTSTWGEEAVKLIQEDVPDVVLLDIRLPDINGYEVCRRLRQNRRTQHLPIIFLTERRERSDRLAGLELGAVDYITKPFDIQELRLRVRNALRRSQLQSLHNPITGLPEGPLVKEQLEAHVQNAEWGIVFTSIRRLDKFRDRYGFVAADDVTRAVSLMLANAIQEGNGGEPFVGHVSAESFIILADLADCNELAQRCRSRLESSVRYFYPAVDRQRLSKSADERLAVEVACLSSQDGNFNSVNEIGEALHTLLA